MIEHDDAQRLRIQRCIEAVRRLRAGHYDIVLPETTADPIDDLGRELVALAGTLDRRHREFAQLQGLSERVGEGVFLAEVLQSIFEGFRDLIPFNRLGCALIERDSRTVVARWARSDAEQLEIYAGYSQPLAGSSLEEILASGEPRILNDLEAYLAEHPESDSTRRIVAEGIRSSLTCPLVAHGTPVGFLFFSSRERHAYDALHPETFLRIARQLSLVIEKSLLYEEVFTLNQRLLGIQRDLEHQAQHDTLTGLPNRRALQSRLEDEIARATRSRSPVGLLLVDVDRFKQVNEAHGHQAGDAVLQAVAARLQRGMRSFECLGRWDGEEFMLVLHDADQEATLSAAERMRASIADERFVHEGTHIPLTVSIGATAGIPDHPAWVELLVHAAATARSRATPAGPNWVLYTPS